VKSLAAFIWVPLLCLLILCSCATDKTIRPALPADVRINPEAGRGGWLIVTVRLASGEKLPMILDTGCPLVAFDNSLVPKLGKKIDTGTFWIFGVSNTSDQYPVPKLYLGKTRLQTSNTNVVTLDCRPLAHEAGRPILGVLGMDVLKHYCLQLDFSANRLRFLNAAGSDKSGWGRPFPLTDIGDGCVFIHENLAGTTNVGSLIDTGCNYDGWLEPASFQLWSNPPASSVAALAQTAYDRLGGETYPNIILRGLDAKLLAGGDTHISYNGIGLPILARNLVTFDFPRNTMYLKRTSIEHLEGADMKRTARAEIESAKEFLKGLQKKGQLPGWSKTDQVAADIVNFHFDYPAIVTVNDLLKKHDDSVYHFRVARGFQHGPWQLKAAWRTDKQGRTLEEYPVP
jgi:hypothetical protein